MDDFWERNKDFITRILAGAAVFLVLYWIVSSFGAESDAERRDRKDLMSRRTERLQQHRDRGGLSSSSTEELMKALKQRGNDVCVGVPADLDKEPRLPVRFVADKQRVARELVQLASDAAVSVTANLQSVDFHERNADDLERYREHWSALESFKRILEGMIKSGFYEIQAVTCDPVQRIVLKDDPEWSLARYGICVEAVGRYDSFAALAGQVNKPGKFVMVYIDKLKQKTGDKPDVLEGVVTGWGLRLEKTKTTGAGRRGSGDIQIFRR